MAQALDTRGSTPRTLFKISLMLGLVLAGVAALAAEPEPTQTETAPQAGCAKTSFEFGGRVTENGESTDNWTLVCWRLPTAEAMAPPIAAAPVAAVPAGTQQARQTGMAGSARF